MTEKIKPDKRARWKQELAIRHAQVIMGILTQLLGEENVSSVPLELFAAPHGLETTLGKLVNIASDIGELDRVAEGFLKQFTGEDRMHFNPKYKTPFTAKPTAKLALAANARPPFRDRSEGLWRRLIVLPFPITIPEEQRNPKLTEELMEELPGILNWALEGQERLWTRGVFLEPAMCKAAKEEYRREANPARTFLEEYVEPDPDASVQTDLLYRSYTEFCQKHGNRKLNESNFGKEVKGCFPQMRRERPSRGAGKTRPYHYNGVRLIESMDHFSAKDSDDFIEANQIF